MASTMQDALRELFAEMSGPLTTKQVQAWIDRRYPRRWTKGATQGHLYGCRIDNPNAYKYHADKEKFLVSPARGVYELYDYKTHGKYENGVLVSPPGDSALGWILIHSESRYEQGDVPDNPIDELAEEETGADESILWHWTRSQPLRESDKPRRVLLAWKQGVFGEAIATVTHKTERGYPRANFAFRLSHYELLPKAIPFGLLRLGRRERNHRDLISLDTEIWTEYTTQKKCLIAELPQIETEACINPQNVRQGYGLTAKERECVELHAMEVAERYLIKEGYECEDVSRTRPFDYLATKGTESLSVEVKGTTGLGDKILLTANEVKHQKAEHPHNMLIIVHSIRLEKGDALNATGGVLQVICPWLIKENGLEPTAYAYTV